jgi:hypothetical protein
VFFSFPRLLHLFLYLFCVVQEQFIMSYGGLRGAVGFSLVKLIDKSIVPSAGIFVTATLAVIMSTVFIQVKTEHRQLYKCQNLNFGVLPGNLIFSLEYWYNIFFASLVTGCHACYCAAHCISC